MRDETLAYDFELYCLTPDEPELRELVFAGQVRWINDLTPRAVGLDAMHANCETKADGYTFYVFEVSRDGQRLEDRTFCLDGAFPPAMSGDDIAATLVATMADID